jgi:hypothetical protein
MFLQFLYTGNYEDSEYPNIKNRPSSPAIMSSGEVEENLANPAGDLQVCSVLSDDDVEDGSFDPDAQEEEENSIEQEEVEQYEHNEFEEGGDYRSDEGLQPFKTDYAHSMFTSIRVYAIADKFDVLALKLLARERFYRSVERHAIHATDFPSVVEELFTTTSPEDILMREIPCRLIGNIYGTDKKFDEGLQPVMRKHGDLALGVLNYHMCGGNHKTVISKDDTPPHQDT